MSAPDPFGTAAWCGLDFHAQRDLLAREARQRLGEPDFVRDVRVEAGMAGRQYDLTLAVETDVGVLRAPLWSHARAGIYCDGSIHAANRERFSPGLALDEAIDSLRRRMAVPFELESRGLTVTLALEDGVERTWVAEHSRFRNRTAVTREDRIARAADLDVRDLLSHFYTGPALRLVDHEGNAFLLREAAEVEGPLVSLCSACNRWVDGAVSTCPHCDSPTDTVIAARPPRR